MEAWGVDELKRRHAGENVSLQELINTGSHGVHSAEGQLEESLGWNPRTSTAISFQVVLLEQ